MGSCSSTRWTAAPRREPCSSSSPASATPCTSRMCTSRTPTGCSAWPRRWARSRRGSASSVASQQRWTSCAGGSRRSSRTPSVRPRPSSAGSSTPGSGSRCMHGFETIEALQEALGSERYLVDDGLATVVFLALRLRRPLLVEGEPGVGKTELAKALAAAAGAPLLRLQCYEGIDLHHALYDWDYPRQLLHLRAGAAGELYSEAFLLRRPLLQALESDPARPAVLLIDELDRADDEFEAFLLEFLSDFQVTIPEVGVVRAEQPPAVVITSNRTRELHEALKRRCLYHWIEHPDLAREVAIARARLPEAPESLVRQVCGFVQELRWLDLYRVPGVGETLDWAQSLDALDRDRVEPVVADRTLGALLKAREDLDRVREEGVERLMERGLERAGEDGHGEAA